MEKNVTLNEARETINHLVQGVDPYTGEVLEEAAFLQNPRMIRCFALMSELLTKIIEKTDRQSQRNRAKFYMTKETADAITFPKGDIGVKAVLAAVNKTIDTDRMSGLTVVTLYKVLKEEGILGKDTGEGSSRTVTTKSSASYGIKTVKSTFQGEEYDRIMYTDQAKDFIKKNLPVWFPET